MSNSEDRASPFDLRDRRAMVSLGPLSKKKYCTYSCPFCYVEAGFAPYKNLGLSEIAEYLSKKRDDYDIIYISGDTDTFAPPRALEGIELVRLCSSFDVDVLFTTRAPLSDENISELAIIARSMKEKSRILIGCVSIAQLNHPHLEPRPIPAPMQRISLLGKLRAAGLVSVLAMRPLLPIVPREDYFGILDAAAPYSDLAISEGWYSDTGGVLDRGVYQGNVEPYDHTIERMYFDENDADWKLFRPEELIEAITEHAAKIQLPLFFKSRGAIDYCRRIFL